MLVKSLMLATNWQYEQIMSNVVKAKLKHKFVYQPAAKSLQSYVITHVQ